MLMAGLAALFFLFNTGQLAREKTKLVNTADAVALSAGMMNARALNFDAYNNRALIANEVLVAQMVSISSWSKFVVERSENLGSVFPECNVPPSAGWAAVIAAISTQRKFDVPYAIMCFAVVNYLDEYISELREIVPPVTETIVRFVEGQKRAIQISQQLLHAPMVFEHLRGDLMQEVADANYANDGSVKAGPRNKVEHLTLPMTDDWAGFTSAYSGNQRGRFAEVTKKAAATDEFVDNRSWTAKATLPVVDASACIGRFNEVRRRGGTELVGYDKWQAEDTESFWEWRRRRWFGCRRVEQPIGWGAQAAYPPGRGSASGSPRLGGSPADNPRASAEARSSSGDWHVYTGLPTFYELSQTQLNKTEAPRMRMAVRLTREHDQALISGARSDIQRSERLNRLDAHLAGGVMAAVSSSEVFFDRPPASPKNPRGGPYEAGSLFNPFWQARLVETSAADLALARLKQGLAGP
ncbi:hypothetical protein HNP55_001138 [Paucibacter oligotrophus]|uniref:Putative Flp pilus-assembly TadG-like N-terminal domain-containing protein n=2 Tax=Roseateles oligotrophus TaxID=1769250 RepID=A0A840L761_9BURK|nr:hypothetical protein [Roseateles oligotrophus]